MTILHDHITPEIRKKAEDLASNGMANQVTVEELLAMVWAEFLYWHDTDIDAPGMVFAIGPLSNVIGKATIESCRRKDQSDIETCPDFKLPAHFTFDPENVEEQMEIAARATEHRQKCKRCASAGVSVTLSVDAGGEIDTRLRTGGLSFHEVKQVLRLFVAALQGQIDDEKKCPAYQPEPEPEWTKDLPVDGVYWWRSQALAAGGICHIAGETVFMTTNTMPEQMPEDIEFSEPVQPPRSRILRKMVGIYDDTTIDIGPTKTFHEYSLSESDDERFLGEVLVEIAKSRKKFPAPDANNSAMVEEVGEVAKALMYEPWANVRKECAQVAGCALRLALEGDCTMVDFRTRQGNSDMPVQQAEVPE